MNEIRQEYAEHIKNRIKQLINIFGEGKLTKFGERIGVDYRTVGNWTKEKNAIPRADQIVVICENLEINAKWLIQGVGELHDRSESQKKVWSALWESAPEYFSDRLLELHKAVLMKKIEEQTKRRSKQLAPVMFVIEDVMDMWTYACQHWLAKIRRLEDVSSNNGVGEESYSDDNRTGGVHLQQEKTSEDDSRRTHFYAGLSIAELKKEMNDYESKIDILLRVFKENRNGNSD